MSASRQKPASAPDADACRFGFSLSSPSHHTPTSRSWTLPQTPSRPLLCPRHRPLVSSSSLTDLSPCSSPQICTTTRDRPSGLERQLPIGNSPPAPTPRPTPARYGLPFIRRPRPPHPRPCSEWSGPSRPSRLSCRRPRPSSTGKSLCLLLRCSPDVYPSLPRHRGHVSPT